MNIFICGLNAKSGGGKSILTNFLKLLSEDNRNENYFVLVPDSNYYKKFQRSKIKIFSLNGIFSNHFILPITYRFYLNRILNNLDIDVIFNLSDIPIKSNLKQIFLFDWPYGVYPESTVWSNMNFKDYVVRKFKLFLFTNHLKYVDHIIAQNDAMQKRLQRIYNLKKISVINNAVSLDNLKKKSDFTFNLPNGKILLYLTYYYPHKNLEIFLKLAELIKQKKLDYKIITTIDRNQGSGAKKFLDNIKDKNLSDTIINIGPVDMKNVPNLYMQSDALLMPTLLESFSGTYVEAMFHEIPIFTSNLDFATSVCQDSAFYFNPLDEFDILEKLEKNLPENKIITKVVENASKRLKDFYDWEQAYSKFIKTILDESSDM